MVIIWITIHGYYSNMDIGLLEYIFYCSKVILKWLNRKCEFLYKNIYGDNITVHTPPIYMTVD